VGENAAKKVFATRKIASGGAEANGHSRFFHLAILIGLNC